MKERYKIIEIYNGSFDSVNVLSVTDSLFYAVHLVELLKKNEIENPCYSYDFRKIVCNVDPVLDFIPVDDFDSAFNCRNYEDFVKRKKNKRG